jgi:hypothetical protein
LKSDKNRWTRASKAGERRRESLGKVQWMADYKGLRAVTKKRSTHPGDGLGRRRNWVVEASSCGDVLQWRPKGPKYSFRSGVVATNLDRKGATVPTISPKMVFLFRKED